ncbi:MAG: type I DNA topoisomerase [Magnetococcales bacterium]|nr:type I DNA topoisomerase [Magnetococcales bacterium]
MTILVIVESPAKAKTIQKFLGKEYAVAATYGHIRDLPSKDGSVDPNEQFAMRYEISSDSTKHVAELTKAAKGADLLLLATDPDREGEAISWHVLETLGSHKEIAKIPCKRVVFHEITKKAILEAVAHPRDIDMNLVNAQQARRALDYLVGFNLSPLLWKKVRRGLSAGRVQSVALRLICERENEIRAFKTREYWSLTAEVARQADPNEARPFRARLVAAEGKKLNRFDIQNETRAQQLLQAVENQPLFVAGIEKKRLTRNPAPPFITSTLQQEASRKLGFSARQTMMVAQKLYEGVEITAPDGSQETVGLITYMRTDSVQLSNEAVQIMRQLIKERYGPDHLPKSARKYKSSAKNAQEAHEAIRPTDPTLIPERLRKSLDRDGFRLYELIWKRTVACQMASAQIDQVAATLSVGTPDLKATYLFRATGSSIAFPGFMDVYSEGVDATPEQERNEDESDTMLPPLESGDPIHMRAITPQQHFTEPPPRYTEASLVKILESYGIGRPSTYAPTMSTLQERGYVKLDQRKFFPEDVGEVVNRFLVEHFEKYVDYHFTAHLEDDLDAVSRGEQAWIPLLDTFWTPFKNQITDKESTTKRSDITTEATDQKCPECEQPLFIKLGRFGRFLACSNYPECRFTQNLKKEGEEEKVAAPPEVSDQNCDKCAKPMLIKEGRFGKYLACSGYPDCRNIQPLDKPVDTGVQCPMCKKGTFLEKKSRRGKIFYSCSGYPKCKNAIWNKPLSLPCPGCGAPFITEKTTKRYGVEHLCATEGCNYREKQPAPPDPEES